MSYQRHTPETWTAIRDAFLSGSTAAELSDRHGVSESAIHARAKAEGWRRSDQPAPPPPDLTSGPTPSLSAMADRALSHSLKLAEAGCLAEALRWARLHRTYADILRSRTLQAEQTHGSRLSDLRRAVEALEAVVQPGGEPADTAEQEKVEEVEPKTPAPPSFHSPLTPFDRERLRKARDKALRRGQSARAAELEARLRPP